MFQIDGGREFDNASLDDHFLNHDIYFRKSCPDTQAQNGVTECKYRHLIEMACAFLIEAYMPATFWVDAIHTAVSVANRLPTPNLQGKSPFEKLFQKSPDNNFLKTFGCACYPNFSTTSANKLAPRSTRCIFLGYAPITKVNTFTS